MQKRKPTVLFAWGGSAVAAVALIWLVGHCVSWHEGRAAWVQAGGSILALMATGGLAHWETRQRRFEAKEREVDQLLARIESAKFAADRVGEHAKRMTYPEPGQDLRSGETAGPALMAVVAATRIQIGDMPTPIAVVHMSQAQLALHRMAQILEAPKGVAHRPLEGFRLGQQLTELLRSIEDLNAEAKRIAG